MDFALIHCKFINMQDILQISLLGVDINHFILYIFIDFPNQKEFNKNIYMKLLAFVLGNNFVAFKNQIA